MKFNCKFNDIKSIHVIEGYWNNNDFANLLEEMDFEEAKTSSPEDLPELLDMALSDLEPHEAATVLLNYKLGDKLTKGQIQNLSHEMVEDDESEEHPDISIHYPLFNINQLLHKAFNGIFPNAKATQISMQLSFDQESEVTKELVLKAIANGLDRSNLILRLYEEPLNGEEDFGNTQHIIWELHSEGQNQYRIITSDNWINKDDIAVAEFTGTVKIFDDGDE
jgi:hypothetical protein